MAEYKLRFWFEHGGPCFWGANDLTKSKYGYAIWPTKLPLSSETIQALNDMMDEYGTYLNKDYPPDPSPWTFEHKTDFLSRANILFGAIVNELGSNYEVVNETNKSVRLN